MFQVSAIRVLKVIPGRTLESTDELWNALSRTQKVSAEAVASDLWPAFSTEAAKHVRDAIVAHDRFHFSKHLQEAVDQVRRGEHKALEQSGDDRLTGSRYLWLTDQGNLGEERTATFESIKNSNLKVSRAWAIRKRFQEFWDQPGKQTGHLFCKSWFSWAYHSRLRPVAKS